MISGLIATLGLRVDARQVREGDRALNDLTRTGARTEQQADRTSASMQRMARMAAQVAAALSVAKVIQYADAWANLQGRLSLVTTSTQHLAQTTEQLFQVAQRTRGGLEATVDLYTKLTRSTQALGTSEADRLAVTETINKAMVVSGASAEQAANAVYQLGQALQGGELRAEEYNSIIDASPRLIQALVDGMGIAQGELRGMMEKGLVTSEVVFNALKSQGAAISAEFEKMPKTVGQAMTQMNNAILRTVGVFDQQNQLSRGLAETISTLASNMGTLVAAASGLAVAMGTKWIVESVIALKARIAATAAATAADNAAAVNAARVNMQLTAGAATAANAELARARALMASTTGLQALTIQTNVLAPAQARATAATAAHVAAQNALAGAAARAAAGTTLLSRAVGLLGGPIGWITTLLGLGATAWMMWGNKSKESEEKATEAVEKSTNEIVADLDKQIEKLKERNALSKVAPDVAKKDTEASRRAAAIQKEIDEANAANGRYAGQSESSRALAVINLTEQLTPLIAKTRELATAQAKADEVAAGGKLESFLAKNSQYLSQAEKLNAALEEAKKHFGGMIPPDVERRIKETFAAKGAKEANTELSKQADLIAELSGLSSDFAEKWDMLSKMHARGALSTAQLTKAQADLLAKQPFMVEQLEAEKNAREALAKFNDEYADNLKMMAKPMQERLKAAEEETRRSEEQARAYGKSADELARLELARLQDQLAQRASIGLTLNEIEHLESLIALKKQDVASKEKIAALEKQKEMVESIEKTAHDAFIGMWKDGKSTLDRLTDTLKNGFLETLYQMTMKKWIVNIAGSVTGGGVAGAAQAAATGGSMLGNLASGLSSAYGAISGGMTLAGGLGTGFMGSIAGGLQGAGIGSGLTSSMGLAIGESIAGVVGSSVATGISSAMSMAAAAMPWLAGLAVAVAVWKKLDTSGTYHAGGAASATSSGVTAINAKSLNMEKIQTNADTQKMVGQLAQSVVGILDSTALAFGKTAGYQAATAFADDTSKDGAWGSLVISKLGQSIVNWQDTRGSGKWAQKTFADGEEGQKQYLAAMAGSVRDALNQIGLPDWAKTMLDSVGQGASIEELGQVVARINETQQALASMRAQLTGFDKMSDGAVSALMQAAGGIENLYASASSFYDNFYSESEKSAAVGRQLSGAFASLNVAMPTSRDEFRKLVEQQMALGESAAPTVAALLALNGAVAQMFPVLDKTTDAAKSAADVLSERMELQDELDELTMTATQLEAKRRNALDASNRSLFDQVRAAEKAKEANDALRESMGRQIDTFKGAADSLRSYGANLMTGNLSTLGPVEQLAEAQAQYSAIAEKALAGEEKALSQFQGAADKFLQLSQQVNGGDSRYSADYAGVLDMVEKLAKYSDSRVDSAQAQIDALDRVTVSVQNLADLLREQYAGGMTPMSAPSQADSQAAAEIAALRAEMKARDEAAAKLQVDSAISNRAVTMQAAEVVAVAVAVPARRTTAASSAAQLDIA